MCRKPFNSHWHVKNLEFCISLEDHSINTCIHCACRCTIIHSLCLTVISTLPALTSKGTSADVASCLFSGTSHNRRRNRAEMNTNLNSTRTVQHLFANSVIGLSVLTCFFFLVKCTYCLSRYNYVTCYSTNCMISLCNASSVIHRESKKGFHPNHGYNFVNSWWICKILSLLQRAVNFQQNSY